MVKKPPMMQTTARICQVKWIQILDSLSLPSKFLNEIDVRMPSAMSPKNPTAMSEGCQENKVPAINVPELPSALKGLIAHPKGHSFAIVCPNLGLESKSSSFLRLWLKFQFNFNIEVRKGVSWSCLSLRRLIQNTDNLVWNCGFGGSDENPPPTPWSCLMPCDDNVLQKWYHWAARQGCWQPL